MFKAGADLTFIVFFALAASLFFKFIPYSNISIFLLIALCALIVYFRLNYERSCAAERMAAPIWHYRKGDQNIGPLSLADIRPLIASGVIANETQVWKEGTKKWSNARTTWPELFKSIPPTPYDKLTATGKHSEVASVHPIHTPGQKCGLAIASLVCGIIGGVFSTASIPAVICGHIALFHIKKVPDAYGGRKMAIAGLILGYIGFVLAIILGTMKGILWSQVIQLRQMGY